MPTSPFLDIPESAWVAANELAFAVRDRHPVTPGHTLVIPRRLVPTWFDATVEEQQALFSLVAEVKAALDRELRPDGYNVGFNAGEAAGQTVMHLHVHVIPRHNGDMDDPRGGVRHVIPERGNYLRGASAELLAGGGSPLGPRLLADLDAALRADLAVAFVLPSGLRSGVLARLRDMLRRPGSRVRVLTGDYQDVTDPAALRELWQLHEETRALDGFVGELQVRVFETQRAKRSFHPKAYVLYADGDGRPVAAYVGSSNLSRTALFDGVEWNLRVDRGTQRVARLAEAFDALFADPATVPLRLDWIERYESRRTPPQIGGAPVVLDVAPEVESPAVVPEPHAIQREALDALAATRAAQNEAGLVVLATGLGKTWLAAFDSVPSRGFERVLFVAHRDEILQQAAATFARVRPGASIGFFAGASDERSTDVVCASVQKLSRYASLDEVFDADRFDYVVIDEFHHATAHTYRRVIDHFEPRFLLGLTATPERADGGDLLALCQQNLVYECALARGIHEGHLSPFHYFGVADSADYPKIPWRSLDEETLTNAVATQARAQNALEQWRARAGTRTVGFCVSQRHADFMCAYFRDHGVRAASVHAGPRSDPRTASLAALEAGELDVLFCVDMFNEGVDVPSIDTVLMLRPTESKTVWLQQLGRGLRRSAGKTHLTVVDYIGNHKVFIHKPHALLQALGIDVTTQREVVAALRAGRHASELPPGCEVSYELQAIDLLEKLFPARQGAGRVQQWYEEFRETNGRRPSALEAYQSSFKPGALRSTFGSWFGFVRAMGDLDDAQLGVLSADADLLTLVETTQLSRSYKLLVLQAMLQRGALPGSLSLPDLAGAFVTLAARSRRLRIDVSKDLDDEDAILTLLRDYPCKLLADARTASGRAAFELRGERFATTDAVRSGPGTALPAMVAELVDWRLAEYLDRAAEGVRFRVLQNSSGNPIVKIDRRGAALPQGVARVQMGAKTYDLTFAKESVDTARDGDGENAPNVLPELLRGWFGAGAGEPGRTFEIRHTQKPDGTIHWEPAGDAGAGGDAEPSQGVPVENDTGVPMDARFLVEERDGKPTVLFMSRGGGRNEAYNEGLETLLRRLGRLGVSLTSVQVESGATRRIDAEGRTLAIDGLAYPLPLGAMDDVATLRKAIGRAGAALGRKPGATGSGNATKRLRLWLDVPAGVEVTVRGLSAAKA